LEYGAVGYSEEDAVTKFGADNIEVYHTYFKPLEWTVSHREDNVCYCKVIVNLNDNQRILGMHVLSPNAAEVIQGWSIGIQMGATKENLEKTIGIHPSISEEFTVLYITKRSGDDAKGKGC